jgi:tetratricopeptide (TPR) repeat protein
MRAPKTAVFCVMASLFTVVGGCAPGQKGSVAITKPKGVDNYVEGVEAMDAGDKAHAVAALQKAIAENPNLITPRMMLGGMYRKDGDYHSAMVQYENLVRLDPYTASNHYYLGLCYQLLDRLQESALSYRNALKLNPDDPDASSNLGLVYLATGRLDDAVANTRRATEIAPKSATAWANYAVTLDAAGEYAKAESAYRRSLELDSSQPTTLLNLATNLVLQNRGGDALPLFEQGLKKQDSALGRKRYGDALVQVKRYDDAVKQYDAAIKMNPRYFPAYNEIGKAFIAMYRAGYELDDSQRQSAVAAWRKSLEINPQQADAQALVQQWSKQPLLR